MMPLHGETLLSGRSLGLRMVGAVLMGLCLFHLVTHVSSVTSHDVLTGGLFAFGAYLTFPKQVEVFLGMVVRLLPWGHK